MQDNIKTFFNLNNTEYYESKFIISKKVQIKDILIDKVADLLFKQAIIEKNWVLATGFDNMKFEKKISKQFEKANSIQIKKIQDKFKNNHFSYIFHRTMNNQKPSFLEFNTFKASFIFIFSFTNGIALSFSIISSTVFSCIPKLPAG